VDAIIDEVPTTDRYKLNPHMHIIQRNQCELLTQQWRICSWHTAVLERGPVHNRMPVLLSIENPLDNTRQPSSMRREDRCSKVSDRT